MTTNTDAAREAAAIEIWEFGVRKEIAREYANAAIDTFLSKALEGADEKLAEIAARIKRAELHENESICFKTNEASELLTLVTALSAKLKRATDEILSEQWKRGELLQELTARSIEMLVRDEASTWADYIGDPMRRLADKIEGGE